MALSLSDFLTLIQSVAIIVTLSVTIYQISRDRAEREYAATHAYLQSHREVWQRLDDDDRLKRIREQTVDLVANPITETERSFVITAINHFYLVYVASKAGLYNYEKADKQDVKEFLELPIPIQVWNEVKKYQKPKFVKFIDSLFTQK